MSEATRAGRVGALLVRALDAATEGALRLAMLALAAIVAAYAYEVTARYLFGAPTRWSADLVSYLLLFVAFMAMPHVTATGGHVAVTVLLERLEAPARRRATQAIALVGAAVCLMLAKIALDETTRQFARGITMMAAMPTPKGWVSVWIVVGFAGSALQFLRLAAAPAREGAMGEEG